MESRKSMTFYDAPAEMWVQAQPLGNGRLGAMVRGGVQKEVISLNQDTLWSGTVDRCPPRDAYAAYAAVRDAALAGEYACAQEIAARDFIGGVTQVYLPFGDLELEFAHGDAAAGYRRTLDLEQALHTVEYTVETVRYSRQTFVSYPDGVLVMRLDADRPGSVNFSARLSSPLRHTSASLPDGVELLGECPVAAGERDPLNQIIYTYPEEEEKKGIPFCGAMRAQTQGGAVYSADGVLTVNGADSAVLILAIESGFVRWDVLPERAAYRGRCHAVLEKAVEKGWELLLQRHLQDYMPLFDALRLELGHSEREDMPTDRRLLAYEKDSDDISLIPLLFDFGRYLTIACSRPGTQASTLQGIWNDQIFPAWRSNYTININTEMNYWPTLGCGLTECYEPLLRFIAERSVAGRQTARVMYHARGFVLHHNTDLWAFSKPVGGSPQWGFWNLGSGWLCRHLFEYYEYTRDMDFLREQGYPIMKQAAQFYLDLLTPLGDRLVLGPTTSPENPFRDADGNICNVVPAAAMSDAIVAELFRNCLRAMELLRENDETFAAELRTALEKMRPFTVGRDGRLMEWNEEFAEPEPNNRHVSHLYGLFPAQLITPSATPELAQACRRSLEARGDDGTGWSLGWKVNFFARLGDGDHALRLLQKQLRPVTGVETDYLGGGGTYPNLFDAHPPFQIDGNFGMVSGVLEMLAQTDENGVHLLPALPAAWKNGSVRGLRLRNGQTVSFTWRDGAVTESSFTQSAGT